MDHRGLEARRHRLLGHGPQTVTRGRGIALLLLWALAAFGCSRKATLMQEEAGSASSVSSDSTVAVFRAAQQAWDAQNDDAHAATLTLQAVQLDLMGRPPSTWGTRSEELLDSLGIGVETAGRPCAMMVNVFVRSDPGRGSSPALYWCDGSNLRWQEVEGKGMRLLGLTSQTGRDADAGNAPVRMAALFARTRLGRQEPLLYTWSRRPKDARWKLSQTLGPDSLGGYGTGSFQASSDTSIDLVTRTYRGTRGFEECGTCPHVVVEHRFRWRPSGFDRVADRDIPSSYAAFVHLIAALQQGSPDAAYYVSDPALIAVANNYEWNRPKGTWRIAPATEEASSMLTFFRGGQEAYRVTFEPRGDDWVVNGIQSVPRSVE